MKITLEDDWWDFSKGWKWSGTISLRLYHVVNGSISLVTLTYLCKKLGFIDKMLVPLKYQILWKIWTGPSEITTKDNQGTMKTLRLYVLYKYITMSIKTWTQKINTNKRFPVVS